MGRNCCNIILVGILTLSVTTYKYLLFIYLSERGERTAKKKIKQIKSKEPQKISHRSKKDWIHRQYVDSKTWQPFNSNFSRRNVYTLYNSIWMNDRNNMYLYAFCTCYLIIEINKQFFMVKMEWKSERQRGRKTKKKCEIKYFYFIVCSLVENIKW